MSQRLGSIWKGRAWDDGNVVPRVTLPDGTLAEAMASMGYGWNATAAAFQKLTVDNATGGLNVVVVGGAAGGGAVTVADGADVAQGATTDLSSASTVIGLLKNLKAALAGTLTTTTSWASAQHVIVDTAPSTAVTGPLTDTQLRATAVPVSLASTVVTGSISTTDAAARSLDGVTQNAVVDVDARRLLEQVLLELKFQTAMLAALAPSALPHDAQLLT